MDSNRDGRTVNVTDGLFEIAEAITSLASAVRALGNGNAITDMGAVEALAVQVREGLDGIAEAVSGGLRDSPDDRS